MHECPTVDMMPVKTGDAVKVVDETYAEHVALVTCVHGEFADNFAPCINVVYVSDDASKRDPYGLQLERMSSLQHFNHGPNHMPRAGRYWVNV